MRRISRETLLAIGLFLLLALVTAFAAVQEGRRQAGEEAPPMSSLSTAPNGAQALWLWLEEVGYAVDNQVGAAFALPAEARLALLLEPTERVGDEEWTTIDDWVTRGGTLLLAGNGWGTMLAVRHYGFALSFLDEEAPPLTAQVPLWASPPLTVPVSARARAWLEPERSDFVTHLAVGDRPVLVSLQQGAGRVVLSAAPFPLTNAGLKEDGNPVLALNLAAAAGRNGAIWFDEWHHGLRGQRQVVGPQDWLRNTPLGQALLYAAGVVFVALLLQGRRFGRPLPLPRETARRSPLEYVTAMANLSRRAGHRRAVRQHYRQRLKRELGRRFRLNPALPDDEYVARIAAYNPHLDTAALRRLLRRLDEAQVGEGEMVQLVAEATHWLEEVR